MDHVTKVRKYIKREQWKTLIKECQSSRMTVTAWCNLNGICEQTYYKNVKKLRGNYARIFPFLFKRQNNQSLLKNLR